VTKKVTKVAEMGHEKKGNKHKGSTGIMGPQ